MEISSSVRSIFIIHCLKSQVYQVPGTKKRCFTIRDDANEKHGIVVPVNKG